MPKIQLRTYHLSSPEAASDYLPRWEAHVTSLREFGVETLGFAKLPGDPSVVVAVVSYPDGADPEAVIREYMGSEGFAGDMAGFDMRQIEQVETVLLGTNEPSDAPVQRAARPNAAPRGAGRLQGKVAVVTGGARGQGEAEARLFAREGARVYLCDILDERGEAIAAEIREAGGWARFVHLNITRAEEWRRLVGQLEEEAGRLDILINNAGVNVRHDLTGTSEDDWDRILNVNLTGQYLGMKECAALMKRSGAGSIVNLGSTAGIMGHPVAAYSSSKWGVRGLTKAAATEFAPAGIRVNALHPGVVATPMMDAGSALFAELVRLTPLGRAADPDELAAAALFLASDDAAFVTGIDLPVDGGFSDLAAYNHVWHTINPK
ncbi:SDR family NAD(P)-dependent oxidoreductase [Amycolatopsis tucumanensis]|uniref:Uncharacterized protein n=1 Tax=Amycolatopsis tucumanensis TaxID=401106 RepID=A0ABP7IUV8_9PSEU|nr:glucose 1-dehydrogenase [Amycolatopsis tucumanensis]MCF6424150.1 glucose 1-dehydrogenase [Amycolatopsis tucumanensis]